MTTTGENKYMKYASIRAMDISNGCGIGLAIFSQGCPYHCQGCHNPNTWSYDGGKEWTKSDTDFLIRSFQENPYLRRLSILGGEPLIPENMRQLKDIILTTKSLFPNKKICLWTGTTIENLRLAISDKLDDCTDTTFASLGWTKESLEDLNIILHHIDVLIDGRFIQEKRDITLSFRGSSNQRIFHLT